MTRHPDAFAWAAAPSAGPALHAGFKGTARMMGPLVRVRYGINDDSATEGWAKTKAAFDRLESEIGPSGYLVGDSFTVADLTAAALFFPLVRPPESEHLVPGPLPEDMERLRAEVAGRPGLGMGPRDVPPAPRDLRGRRRVAADDAPPHQEAPLAERLLRGDKRALARGITLVENDDPAGWELVREVYPHTGKARIVGFTGPPGVGKSTLIGALVGARARPRARGRRAVDRPVEPVHGGRAARGPDPACGALPRRGRLHPLDGEPRGARRAVGGDAPGACS